MKKHKKNRNVAIIGIGQTSLSSHKEDQNQVEMVQEAVINALQDAGLTIDDIDCIVHGNMELFEMQFAAGPLAFAGHRRLRQGRIPDYHRRDNRRDAGLRRGQPRGLRPLRHGAGHRLGKTPGRQHHRRHHQHGRPAVVPQPPDRRADRNDRRGDDRGIR